jgi:hypothetical protein
MAIEKREMNGNWDLDPIREGFIYVILLQQKPLNLQKKYSKFRISDKSFEIIFLRHQNTFV